MFGGSRKRSLTDYERRLVNNVHEFGWSCTTVFDPDGEDASFSYSIGFTSSLTAPELIVFGLAPELMHSMLSEAYRQIKDGKSVEESSRWSNLIEGFECVARKVDSTNVIREHLNSAIWYWNHIGNNELPPVFQLVWPGKLDGLFPWDEGCSEIVRQCQPPLWLER